MAYLKQRHPHLKLGIVDCFCFLVAKSCPTLPTQGPQSMGFPRQEYWSGLPFPSARDLPNPGIEPTSLVSPALAGRVFIHEPSGKGMAAAFQAPPSTGFSKQEFWSGVPLPTLRLWLPLDKC